MAMEAFFTREKANEGTKVPLRTPEGQDTEHYLVIRSQWSDQFQQAKTDVMRSELEAPTGKGLTATERHIGLCAALVAGWSFEEECTQENVKKFLREAPQLRDMIDRFASSDARFFGKPSSGSTTGRKRK